ncbi:hypothetical protein C0995_011873 [Termitomyces sp. Mi166|nr:hypothetical protein C0995_011873 [Termitomyces sp. Mi166\
MFFLRRAHELYNDRPQKSLSPSFWESEGQSPLEMHGIDAIMSGIEHPLGRLSYTTGDVASAVRFFLGLLRGSTGKPLHASSFPSTGSDGGNKLPDTDKVYLDDFRVAYAHFKETSPESKLNDLKLPFTFCLTRQTRLRLSGDMQDGPSGVWNSREERWRTFYKSLGHKEGLSASGKASVNEVFWVDLVLRNPLNTEINLSNLTVTMQESNVNDLSASTSFVEVEVINDIALAAKESRTVPISIQSSRATSLVITHATYDFLSLLPSAESLASRGRRLHDTAAQRLQPTYAPDVKIKVEIEDIDHKLLVDFVDDEQLVLAQGERKELKFWFSNSGGRPIKEIWMIAGPEDEIWFGQDEGSDDTGITASTEVIQSHNSLEPRKPLRIPFDLNPSETTEYPIQLHAEAIGNQELHLLFVYREIRRSISRPSTLDLICQSKRSVIIRGLSESHPHIPRESYPRIFPLYHPESIDFIVFWEIPSQQRSGYIVVSGLSLGAGHAALGSIIEEAENAKVKRSIYAETQREKEEILDAIRNSEWNTEMNPTVLVLQEPTTTHHDFGHGFGLSLGSMQIRTQILREPNFTTDRFQQPLTIMEVSYHLLT